MRTATLVSTQEHVRGGTWKLWSLSAPLLGHAQTRSGRSEPLHIYYVLTVERCLSCRVLESNSKGELVAWGAWPASRGDDAKDSLGRLGYAIERAVA